MRARLDFETSERFSSRCGVELGVTSFGSTGWSRPGGVDGCTVARQEEVSSVLEGRLALIVEGEATELVAQGVLIRVPRRTSSVELVNRSESRVRADSRSEAPASMRA